MNPKLQIMRTFNYQLLHHCLSLPQSQCNTNHKLKLQIMRTPNISDHWNSFFLMSVTCHVYQLALFVTPQSHIYIIFSIVQIKKMGFYRTFSLRFVVDQSLQDSLGTEKALNTTQQGYHRPGRRADKYTLPRRDFREIVDYAQTLKVLKIAEIAKLIFFL